MSPKKPTGGRVTPKGTQAAKPAKRAVSDRAGLPGRSGSDPFAAKARSFRSAVAPTRSGHHRGNR